MRKSLSFIIVLVLALAVSIPAVAGNGNGKSEGKRNSFKKEAIENDRLPDFTSIFNWGLKLKNFKELYLLAGITDNEKDFPFDPNGATYEDQTINILAEFDEFLGENNLTRDDIVRIEFTLVDGFTQDDFNAILGAFGVYFADVEVKPAAGTLRVVSALALPGALVEYEIWAAK